MNKKYTKYLVLSVAAFVMIALVIFVNINKQKDSAKEMTDSQEVTNDSASMNIWLHKQVMAKLAASGGKVPEDLRT